MLNIIDIFEKSVFLDKIYPQGIERLSIQKIDFINIEYGSSFLYIYTNEKPHIEIPKYGSFGKDYDTIVITASCRIKNIEIINAAKNSSYHPIKIRKTNDGYQLYQKWEEGYLKIDIENKFIFQGTSVYIHDNLT